MVLSGLKHRAVTAAAHTGIVAAGSCVRSKRSQISKMPSVLARNITPAWYGRQLVMRFCVDAEILVRQQRFRPQHTCIESHPFLERCQACIMIAH